MAKLTEENFNRENIMAATKDWSDKEQVELGLFCAELVLPHYTGLSPEVSQFGNEAVGGSVDTNPFPLSKSVYLTLSMGF